MYQRFDFACDGKAFVRFQLSRGPTVGSALCELPIELGQVFSFLPKSLSSRELLHFGWPFDKRERQSHEGLDDYKDKTVQWLDEYLKDGQHWIMFYGRTVPPGGKPVSESGEEELLVATRKIFYPNSYDREVPFSTEVYYIVKGPASISSLKSGMNRSFNNHVRAVVFSDLKSSVAIVNTRELDENSTKLLTSHVEVALVTAYDGDAVLIWTKSKTALRTSKSD